MVILMFQIPERRYVITATGGTVEPLYSSHPWGTTLIFGR